MKSNILFVLVLACASVGAGEVEGIVSSPVTQKIKATLEADKALVAKWQAVALQQGRNASDWMALYWQDRAERAEAKNAQGNNPGFAHFAAMPERPLLEQPVTTVQQASVAQVVNGQIPPKPQGEGWMLVTASDGGYRWEQAGSQNLFRDVAHPDSAPFQLPPDSVLCKDGAWRPKMHAIPAQSAPRTVHQSSGLAPGQFYGEPCKVCGHVVEVGHQCEHCQKARAVTPATVVIVEQPVVVYADRGHCPYPGYIFHEQHRCWAHPQWSYRGDYWEGPQNEYGHNRWNVRLGFHIGH